MPAALSLIEYGSWHTGFEKQMGNLRKHTENTLEYAVHP